MFQIFLQWVAKYSHQSLIFFIAAVMVVCIVVLMAILEANSIEVTEED